LIEIDLKKPFDSKPKCQDGIICKNKNEGFIVLQYLDEGKREPKIVCYPCVKQRQAQNDKVMFEMYGKINKVE